MSNQLWGLLGGFLGGLLYSLLFAKVIRQWMDKRREMKYLRFISVRFPGAKVIEAISISSTDEEAMRNVERRIRDASRTL